MLRNFIRSSIIRQGNKLDQWLKNNRCVLCSSAATNNPWCTRCLGDLPAWTGPPLHLPAVDKLVVGYRYEFPLDRLIQVKFLGLASQVNFINADGFKP